MKFERIQRFLALAGTIPSDFLPCGCTSSDKYWFLVNIASKVDLVRFEAEFSTSIWCYSNLIYILLVYSLSPTHFSYILNLEGDLVKFKGIQRLQAPSGARSYEFMGCGCIPSDFF